MTSKQPLVKTMRSPRRRRTARRRCSMVAESTLFTHHLRWHDSRVRAAFHRAAPGVSATPHRLDVGVRFLGDFLGTERSTTFVQHSDNLRAAGGNRLIRAAYSLGSRRILHRLAP